MNRMMSGPNAATAGNPTNVAQTPAPDASPAPPAQSETPPIEESGLPPEAIELVNGAKAVLFDDRFKPTFKQAVESAADFASAAAVLVMGLIERAQQKLGVELPPEILYADGGVADYLMDAVFAYGQGVQVEEAADAAAYAKALDMVEEMGGSAAPPQTDAAPAPAPAAAPPMMGGA